MSDSPRIDIFLGNQKTQGTGNRIKNWTSFSMTSEIDSAANAFTISLPFEDTPENRDSFRPFSSGVVDIYSGSDRLLLGYFEAVNYSFSPSDRTVSLAGRSASGAILEWSAGGKYFPVYKSPGVPYTYADWDKQSTRKITTQYKKIKASALCKEIAGAHIISFDPDLIVGPVTIEPGQSIFDVISKIAAANGYFGVPDKDGGLVYRNNLGKEYKDVTIREGDSRIRRIQSNHDVTNRFWRYVCLGADDSKKHVDDTRLLPAIRGVRIIEPEQESQNLQEAAKFARSRAIIDSYKVSIDIDGLTYSEGSFWKAGDVVGVYAPSAAIYDRDTKLIIKRATLSIDASSGAHTTLELGLPELYSGGFPEVFPWDS